MTTVHNENLKVDMVLGIVLWTVFSYVFIMAFVPALYAVVLATLLSAMFNWLYFRKHLSRMCISEEGALDLYDVRGRYWRRLRVGDIQRVSFLEGGMAVASPRLKITLLGNNADVTRYLASRRRSELIAFMEKMRSAGMRVVLER